MERENEGGCVAMVIAVVGFLANIVNLISLFQFIVSLRSGKIDTEQVNPFYLPFPLEQVDYALIAGILLFYGTVATGVFLWFLASRQLHISPVSRFRGWLVPQILAVLFFSFIYWLAFKELLEDLLEDSAISSFPLFILIFLFFLTLPGVLSYYLYEGWSHPRRGR